MTERYVYWTAWVTTAPRGFRPISDSVRPDATGEIDAERQTAGEALLINTINSLAAAGWDRVCVLAEPHSPRPRSDRIPGTTMLWAINNATAGPWRNFVNALRIAVRNEPLSDRILLCQDDIAITGGLRRHLDREPSFASCLADPQFGVASLYCAEVNRALAPGDGWFDFPLRLNPSVPQGALAYVFTKESAESLLATAPQLPQTPDCVERKVARWCQLTGRHYLAHRPSFVQHMGNGLSTIRPGDDSDLTSNRQASDFIAEITRE